MGAFLGSISGVGFLVCLIMIIVSVVKKSGKTKKWAIGTGACFLLFIVALAITPSTPSTPTSATVADKTPEQIAQEKADADLKAKQEAEAKAAADKARAEAEAKKKADELASLKANATTPPYKDLARNPDNYKGTKVKYTGEVIQVQEEGKNVGLRVNVTKGAYGTYTDTIYVMYDKNVVSGRVLEDDIITFYGTSAGLLTYKTVMGAEMTIPQVLASIVEIN